MELKIVLSGLGGQGVVFLTRLFAKAAIAMQVPVLVSETHGMSQRGGSVISHLKIGEDQSPLIMRGTADFLLSLEQDEAVRRLAMLRPQGVAIVNADGGMQPALSDHLTRLGIEVWWLPATTVAMEIGSPAIANVVLAGFAAAHKAMPFSFEILQEALSSSGSRGLELNRKALEAGYQAGRTKLPG